MWNYEYRPYPGTDDFVEYDFPAETGAVGRGKPMEVERYYWIGESRRMYYNARLYVDPKPALENPEGIRFKEVLGPLIAPFDLKGIGALEYRYIDRAKQDDTWLYVPSLRRVRRLSTAQRSDALSSARTPIRTRTGATTATSPGRNGSTSARRTCSASCTAKSSRRSAAPARPTI
jgi:hypothetical protein